MKALSRYIGIVRAGFPSPAADYRMEDIDLEQLLGVKLTSVYYARVLGHSMVGAHIPHDSLIVIDKSLKPQQNDIIIATLNGELILKHFVKRNGRIYLIANPATNSLEIKKGMDFSIWGVVVNVIIDYKKKAP